MAVLMSVGGNTVSGAGFLVAPQGMSYETEIALWTDVGTASVTLQADPANNVANLVFSNPGPISLTTTPTIVTVHAQHQSNTRGDTIIQVLEGTTVSINFVVTAISHPVVNFKGRFEARFATDGARPYANPTYTATIDSVVPPGRTWALEGEPDFCPGSVVPENLENTGMGRTIRLNNPVALRGPVGTGTGQVRPVVSTVDSITGETGTNSAENFTAGDPIIGLPVNFGPDTYLAGNNNSSDTPGPAPTPEEFWQGGDEPLALFEINIGNSFSPPATYFRGSSTVSAFVAKATVVNTQTRATDTRPITHVGIQNATNADYAAVGITNSQKTYTEARIDAVLATYLALPAGPSVNRRNLVRRIGHLLNAAAGTPDAVSSTKITNVQGQAVAPDVFSLRQGSLHVDFYGKETFTGKVDSNLHANAAGSGVIAYMTEFFAFDAEWNAFGFHTDDNCGHHIGKLSGDLTRTGNHIGDPHVHTVNGIPYDFQAVGEFTLLQDGNRMEIQTRQTPVATANPVQDAHSELTECVSINTAVAVRVGRHRISLQQDGEQRTLHFYVDGKQASFPQEGFNLGDGRVSGFTAASGEPGVRVDYADGTVVTVTPYFWTTNNVWYLDVSVANTRATEGIMGIIPHGHTTGIGRDLAGAVGITQGSWLPRLRDGSDLGPRPAALHDRYVQLYKTFADSWRVTDKTSLFVYAPGTNTETFTDRDWPAEQLPCKLKPGLGIPGAHVLKGMSIERTEVLCKVITDKDLHRSAVFDVATTGDPTFIRGYLDAQEHRHHGTSVRVNCFPSNKLNSRKPECIAEVEPLRDESYVVIAAQVLALDPKRPTPTGTVTFFVDGVPLRRPVALDSRGWASAMLNHLKPGEHTIRATYHGGGKHDYDCSTSGNHICTLAHERMPKRHTADQG
jgi:hypothetical protein